MFGPLPRLHQLLLVGTSLLVGIASGAWTAHFTVLPVAVGVGAALGAVAGLLAALALVHEFSARPRTARIPRRR